MKSIVYILTLAVLFVGCNNAKESSREGENRQIEEKADYVMSDTHDIFGDKEQSFENKMEIADVYAKYEAMSVGDSMRMVFNANIEEVCKVSGCWMNMELTDSETTHVTFKDYKFFVPKDAAGKQAMVTGWAHKKEKSVEDLRHYAEDAGKSKEEIEAITEPEVGYSFVADAVLIEKAS